MKRGKNPPPQVAPAEEVPPRNAKPEPKPKARQKMEAEEVDDDILHQLQVHRQDSLADPEDFPKYYQKLEETLQYAVQRCKLHPEQVEEILSLDNDCLFALGEERREEIYAMLGKKKTPSVDYMRRTYEKYADERETKAAERARRRDGSVYQREFEAKLRQLLMEKAQTERPSMENMVKQQNDKGVIRRYCAPFKEPPVEERPQAVLDINNANSIDADDDDYISDLDSFNDPERSGCSYLMRVTQRVILVLQKYVDEMNGEHSWMCKPDRKKVIRLLTFLKDCLVYIEKSDPMVLKKLFRAQVRDPEREVMNAHVWSNSSAGGHSSVETVINEATILRSRRPQPGLEPERRFGKGFIWHLGPMNTHSFKSDNTATRRIVKKKYHALTSEKRRCLQTKIAAADHLVDRMRNRGRIPDRGEDDDIAQKQTQNKDAWINEAFDKIADDIRIKKRNKNVVENSMARDALMKKIQGGLHAMERFTLMSKVADEQQGRLTSRWKLMLESLQKFVRSLTTSLKVSSDSARATLKQIEKLATSKHLWERKTVEQLVAERRDLDSSSRSGASFPESSILETTGQSRPDSTAELQIEARQQLRGQVQANLNHFFNRLTNRQLHEDFSAQATMFMHDVIGVFANGVYGVCRGGSRTIPEAVNYVVESSLGTEEKPIIKVSEKRNDGRYVIYEATIIPGTTPFCYPQVSFYNLPRKHDSLIYRNPFGGFYNGKLQRVVHEYWQGYLNENKREDGKAVRSLQDKQNKNNDPSQKGDVGKKGDLDHTYWYELHSAPTSDSYLSSLEDEYLAESDVGEGLITSKRAAKLRDPNKDGQLQDLYRTNYRMNYKYEFDPPQQKEGAVTQQTSFSPFLGHKQPTSRLGKNFDLESSIASSPSSVRKTHFGATARAQRSNRESSMFYPKFWKNASTSRSSIEYAKATIGIAPSNAKTEEQRAQRAAQKALDQNALSQDGAAISGVPIEQPVERPIGRLLVEWQKRYVAEYYGSAGLEIMRKHVAATAGGFETPLVATFLPGTINDSLLIYKDKAEKQLLLGALVSFCQKSGEYVASLREEAKQGGKLTNRDPNFLWNSTCLVGRHLNDPIERYFRHSLLKDALDQPDFQCETTGLKFSSLGLQAFIKCLDLDCEKYVVEPLGEKFAPKKEPTIFRSSALGGDFRMISCVGLTSIPCKTGLVAPQEPCMAPQSEVCVIRLLEMD